MKNLLTLGKFLPCILFYFLCSCQSGPVNPPEPVVLVDCGELCNYLRVDADSTFEISQACADCLTKNFVKNDYTFPRTGQDQSGPVRGFKMNNSEIVTFFEIIKADSVSNPGSLNGFQVSVYGMFGIYHGLEAAGSERMITSAHQ